MRIALWCQHRRHVNPTTCLLLNSVTMVDGSHLHDVRLVRHPPHELHKLSVHGLESLQKSSGQAIDDAAQRDTRLLSGTGHKTVRIKQPRHQHHQRQNITHSFQARSSNNHYLLHRVKIQGETSRANINVHVTSCHVMPCPVMVKPRNERKQQQSCPHAPRTLKAAVA